MPAAETTPARPLPTIWELPDDLWEEIEPMLDRFYPSARTGRRRADWRLVLDGIILPSALGLPVASPTRALRCSFDRSQLVFNGPPQTGSWRSSGLGLKDAVVEDIYCGDRGEVVVAVRPKWRERDRCGVCRRRRPGFGMVEGRRRWRALDLASNRQ